MNFNASLQLQRIATAPTFRWWRPIESLSTNDASIANMNGPPKPFMTYKAFDQSGKQVPAPTDVNVTSDITDVTQNIISKDSDFKLGRTIIQLIAMTFDGINAESIEVNAVNGQIVSNTKDKNLRKLLAFTQVITSNPEAAKLAPVIIENLDIDEKAKQFLMMQYGQNQQQAQIPPQVQQQMFARDQQIAQMTSQIEEQKNLISQLQMSLFEYQKHSKAMIIKTQMEIESKERIELWKLQAAKGELNAELEAKQQMQSQKLIADYMKEMNKFEKPEVMPTFNAGRFV